MNPPIISPASWWTSTCDRPIACRRSATNCAAKPTARCRGCSCWPTPFTTARCRPGRWAPPTRSRARSMPRASCIGSALPFRTPSDSMLPRAALLHDVGKAFVPVQVLDKPGKLSDEELEIIRKHPRLGYDALALQGGFPPEMLDVVLHHHELLDGSGYPEGLRSHQISDIVRLTTIVDIHAALVEKRAYRLPFTHAKAFAIMEQMGGKLDQHLLQALRPVALGSS